MAWTPAIPQATDFISASQPLILGNFQALDVWSQVDHSAIDVVIGENGYHKKVTLIPQAPAPNSVGQPGFGGFPGFFSFLNLATARSEIYTNFSNATQRPLTASSAFPAAAAVEGVFNDFFFYLPNGFLVKMNWIDSALGGGTHVFSTPANWPAFTGTPAVFTCAQSLSFIGTSFVTPTTITPLQFSYTASTGGLVGTPDFWFIAIGPS